jgi:quinol monooxygenase YgiN
MLDDGSPTCVSIATTLHAKPGHESELAAALLGLAASARAHEPGCLLYQPVRSRHEPTRFLVFERYRDEASLAAHANSEHVRAAMPALARCLAAAPAVVVYDELGAEAGRPAET